MYRGRFVLLLAVVSACASQPATHYYTLTAGQALTSAARLPASTSLGVGPITLPPMLDRNGIVTQQPGGSQIEVASHDIWAGDLKVLFTRVTAELIAENLNSAAVWAAPWDTRQRPPYQLRVFVDSFSGERGGPVTLKLKWDLLAEYGQQRLGTWRFEKTENAETESYASYVQTLNQLLADFAAEAAATVSGMINEPGVYPAREDRSEP